MLIKNMLDDVGDESIRQDNPIPIPNVCFQTRDDTSPIQGC
jgi:hypothetical protein